MSDLPDFVSPTEGSVDTFTHDCEADRGTLGYCDVCWPLRSVEEGTDGTNF